jgi:starch phosphorylase
MKRSMHLIGSYFNTNRMAADYLRDYYLDAGERFQALAANGPARAQALAAWRQRIRELWSGIRVEDVRSAVGKALLVGDKIEVVARVRLGDLRPEDVQVQLGVGALAVEDQIEDAAYARMTPDEKPSDGIYTYRCAMPCIHSGRRGYAVRVLPFHPDLVHPFEPGMVVWG